jgi:hypothetical protein
VVAALAVPAAPRLPSGVGWARTVLVVLAAMTMGSIYRCVLVGAWPALALNVPLAATFGLLRTASSQAFFAAVRDRRP